MDWQDEDDIDAPQEMDLHPDGEDDDDGGVVDCPFCREWISEHAPRCPHCGQWIAGDSLAARRSSGWFWPVMVAVLVAVIVVIWCGL